MSKAPPSSLSLLPGDPAPDAPSAAPSRPDEPASAGATALPTGKPVRSAAAKPTAPARADAPAAAPMPASYELALAELEKIVARIDAGQMPLEELLTGYRRGADLLAFCRERLQAVEEQIKVLDNGVLKPWSAT